MPKSKKTKSSETGALVPEPTSNESSFEMLARKSPRKIIKPPGFYHDFSDTSDVTGNSFSNERIDDDEGWEDEEEPVINSYTNALTQIRADFDFLRKREALRLGAPNGAPSENHQSAFQHSKSEPNGNSASSRSVLKGANESTASKATGVSKSQPPASIAQSPASIEIASAVEESHTKSTMTSQRSAKSAKPVYSIPTFASLASTNPKCTILDITELPSNSNLSFSTPVAITAPGININKTNYDANGNAVFNVSAPVFNLPKPPKVVPLPPVPIRGARSAFLTDFAKRNFQREIFNPEIVNVAIPVAQEIKKDIPMEIFDLPKKLSHKSITEHRVPSDFVPPAAKKSKSSKKILRVAKLRDIASINQSNAEFISK